MKRTVLFILLAALALGWVGCVPAAQQTPAPSDELQLAAARNAFMAITEGRYEDAYASFAPAAQQQISSATVLAQLFSGLEDAVGTFEAVESASVQPSPEEGVYLVSLTARYALQIVAYSIPLDAQCRILSIQAVDMTLRASEAMPEGIREEELVITADSAYPLPAKLTLPEGTGPFPAVLLLPGSGNNDIDGTIGNNRVYQQLAWGLAQRGIAVLRVEKRTTAHSDKITTDEAVMRALTVREEYIDDALAALKQLKADSRIADVSLLGHSLGAMLAPRIATEAGDGVERLILMAGSPRTLSEIMIEQFTAIVAQQRAIADDASKDEAVRASAKANADQYEGLLDSFINVMDALPGMSDEDAKKNWIPLGGSSAYYFKEMNAYDAAEMLIALGKPALILQGGKDYQVRSDTQFEAWVQRLASYEAARFALYPELNHLFMPSAVMDATDYNTPGHIAEEVFADIAGFVSLTTPPRVGYTP